MPKASKSQFPYHLSLPSPTGLPLHSTFYRRMSPSSPTPMSGRTPQGPLHAFAKEHDIVVKREPGEDMVPGSAGEDAQGAPMECDAVGANLKSEEVVEGNPAEPPRPSRLVALAGGGLPEIDDRDGLSSVTVSFPRRGSRMRQAPKPLYGETLVSRRVQERRRKPRTSLATTRRDLRDAQVEINTLKARITTLERAERQLKGRITRGRELVKDARVEAEESRTEVLRAEERLDEMNAGMRNLRREFVRYRGWWLTENRCLNVVLREVPERKWDEGLQAIASSSHSRFMSYSNSN